MAEMAEDEAQAAVLDELVARVREELAAAGTTQARLIYLLLEVLIEQTAILKGQVAYLALKQDVWLDHALPGGATAATRAIAGRVDQLVTQRMDPAALRGLTDQLLNDDSAS